MMALCNMLDNSANDCSFTLCYPLPQTTHTVPLYHCTRVSYRCTTVPVYHHTTVPLYHYTIILVHTVPPYHWTTIPLYQCVIPVYKCTTVSLSCPHHVTAALACNRSTKDWKTFLCRLSWTWDKNKVVMLDNVWRGSDDVACVSV